MTKVAYMTAWYSRKKSLSGDDLAGILRKMKPKTKREMPAEDMVKVAENSLAMFGGTDKRKGGSKRPSR